MSDDLGTFNSIAIVVGYLVIVLFSVVCACMIYSWIYDYFHFYINFNSTKVEDLKKLRDHLDLEISKRNKND